MHADGSDQKCRLGALDSSDEILIATLRVNYQVRHDGNRTLHAALTWLPHSRETAPTIQIPTEVLHQGWAILFPAERMAVIGSRYAERSIILGPVFDVTSDDPETNCAHVRADPNRLRAALIAMERAGAHLAGWIHSHPGCGPGATEPSLVDRAQHRDWVRDYSPALVSLIIVVDGIVRVWGTAVEAGVVRTELTGKGVTSVNGYEHVYQLSR